MSMEPSSTRDSTRRRMNPKARPCDHRERNGRSRDGGKGDTSESLSVGGPARRRGKRGPQARTVRWVTPDSGRKTYHEGDAEAHGSGASDEAGLTSHGGDLLGDHLDGHGLGDHGLAGGHAGGEGGPAENAGGRDEIGAQGNVEGPAL